MLVKAVVVHDSSDTSPHVRESFLVPHVLLLVFPRHTWNFVVLCETKLDEITESPRVFDPCVVKQRSHGVPHCGEFIGVFNFPVFNIQRSVSFI
jgi:hypothetical protein